MNYRLLPPYEEHKNKEQLHAEDDSLLY